MTEFSTHDLMSSGRTVFNVHPRDFETDELP